MQTDQINSFKALKDSGYKPKSIKEELRSNLLEALKADKKTFEKIWGFDHTVLPEIERAILSKHNILLLGLRGQAKTRIARQMVQLLDEYIPVVKGSPINDDPFNPISRYAQNMIAEHGDDCPVEWVHRSSRFVEKLATPDVRVSDLIGDVDPIKAANLKLDYSDERVLHFGLIPRAHRSIFVLNELPDLQARIQVSLFNILQEGDIQIRGFKLRLPLDVQFVFTANPEDYTNRGSIITPLKDRIESQILTHYPLDIKVAMQITEQEANIEDSLRSSVYIHPKMREMIDRLAFIARESEYVDEKSGVSARLSIAALENLYSTVERRMLKNNEDQGFAHLIDLWGVVPAITGKMELVYEGEQEGALWVARQLLDELIKDTFLNYFPHPNKLAKGEKDDPFAAVNDWFAAGNILNLNADTDESTYRKNLDEINGLEAMVVDKIRSAEEKYFFMELLVNGLAAYGLLTKEYEGAMISFNDSLAGLLDDDSIFKM